MSITAAWLSSFGCLGKGADMVLMLSAVELQRTCLGCLVQLLAQLEHLLQVCHRVRVLALGAGLADLLVGEACSTAAQ
jgi:hypothetical protein